MLVGVGLAKLFELPANRPCTRLKSNGGAGPSEEAAVTELGPLRAGKSLNSLIQELKQRRQRRQERRQERR